VKSLRNVSFNPEVAVAITKTARRSALEIALSRTSSPACAAFGLLGLWVEWQERHRLRRDLRRLLRAAPHMVDDIGVTPGEARREAAKPFWQF